MSCKDLELKLQLYRMAVETRNMEIDLFWKRSNYFLVLNTAIAVGFFTQMQGRIYAPILAGFGIIVSLLWFRVNIGSKYWQSRWENRCSVIEHQLKDGIDLFSASRETIRKDVFESLSRFKHGRFRTYLDNFMLEKKPSVSLQMIWLSGFFIGLWGVVFCMSLFGLDGHAP